jgi:lysyl endopeptidase
MMNARSKFVALSVAFAALALGGPARGASPFYAEAPMRVMKQGLTVEQELQKQVGLSRSLLSELPAAALAHPVRVALDADRAAALDKASRFETPLRIGVVQPMAPAITVAGLDKTTSDTGGTFTWGSVIRVDGAGAIRLHIEGLSLPAGAALYVYSRGGEAYGPYTGAGPDGSGDLWTTAVFGKEAILQLRFAGAPSPAALRRVALRVTEIGLITRKFAGDLAGILPTPSDDKADKALWPCGNQSCLLDATCSNVAAANPAKLAMAKMEWISGAFIHTCTGGLISDNNPTQSNFLLTANHCFSKSNVAKTVSFYWQFATSGCNSTCPSNTSWPFKTTGASVSASATKGDFTLVHLNANPPAGSVFLGWTSAPVANTNGTHLYRISNPIFGPQVYSQHDVDTSAGQCQGWPRGERIYSRDMTGAIDGGSSGSPVLNASSQIVGQLSGTCGTASSEVCSSGPGEANATVDGAFAFYFATVQPILNP